MRTGYARKDANHLGKPVHTLDLAVLAVEVGQRPDEADTVRAFRLPGLAPVECSVSADKCKTYSFRVA